MGDRLRVVAGERTIAELEVVSVAERWSSCRPISRTRPIATGDVVVPLVPTRVAAASPTRRTPTPTPTPSLYAATRRSRRRRWRPRRSVLPRLHLCPPRLARRGPLLRQPQRPSRRSPPHPAPSLHWLRVPSLRPRRPGHVQGQVPLGRERLPRRGPGAGSPSGRPARGRGRDGRRRARGRLRGRDVGLVQAALGEAPGARRATSPGSPRVARPRQSRRPRRWRRGTGCPLDDEPPRSRRPPPLSTPGPPARGPACAAAPRSATTRPGTRRSRTTTSRSARGGWTSGSTTSVASR